MTSGLLLRQGARKGDRDVFLYGHRVDGLPLADFEVESIEGEFTFNFDRVALNDAEGEIRVRFLDTVNLEIEFADEGIFVFCRVLCRKTSTLK
jgi:hypothetical protein